MAGPGIEPGTLANLVRSSNTELPRMISTDHIAPSTTIHIELLWFAMVCDMISSKLFCVLYPRHWLEDKKHTTSWVKFIYHFYNEKFFFYDLPGILLIFKLINTIVVSPLWLYYYHISPLGTKTLPPATCPAIFRHFKRVLPFLHRRCHSILLQTQQSNVIMKDDYPNFKNSSPNTNLTY